MPIFEISNNSIKPIEQNNFNTEKDLQRLIEGNLKTVDLPPKVVPTTELELDNSCNTIRRNILNGN